MLNAGLTPDVVTYRTIIGACARKPNPQLAEEWLTKMVAASHPLDVMSCSAVMSAYAAAGDRAGAEHWLLKMQAEGVVVDHVGYNVLIRAWSTGKAMMSDDAEVPAGDCLTDSASLSLEHAEGWLWKALEAGVKPSQGTLHVLLEAFVDTGDAEGTRRIEDVLRQLGHWPSAWACAVVAKPYAVAGDYEAVEDTLDGLRRKGVQPDLGCLRVLLCSYARARRSPWDRAEACFWELHALGGLPSRSALKLTTSQQQVLIDCRRALGAKLYGKLSSDLSLPALTPPPDAEARARRRIAGRCVVIAPAGDEGQTLQHQMRSHA